MVRRLLALPLLFLLAPAAASADPVTTEQLRRHIEVLASDHFEGREPGTAGEAKTVAYISGMFAAAGLDPGGEGGGWTQMVALTTRTPAGQQALFTAGSTRIELDQSQLVLIGRSAQERLRKAAVLFGGDDAAGQDVKGRIVFLSYNSGPSGKPFTERARGVAERGAEAVIAIFPAEVPWRAVQGSFEAGQTRLAGADMAPIQGAISEEGFAKLTAAAGSKSGDGRQGSRLRADLSVETEVKTIQTANVIGRLPGSGGGAQSVMFLGHWDHLGTCRAEGEKDRICNGAVDNASGIAVLIETARALAKGPRPVRDILFMATTAEEIGLLGAAHYAAKPTVPLKSIVAALNLDTVAIHGKGRKVAVLGRGNAALDAAVAAGVKAAGRVLDSDGEADSFVTRQDGWALMKEGVPAIMVGGSFSDMKELGAFLSGPYHGPDDDLGRPLILEGAAEDADLMIALGRRLADPALYPAASPPTPAK
jgi:Zn-dependent M28 family amino/carboxypeptidase